MTKDKEDLLKSIRNGIFTPERSNEYWKQEERDQLEFLFRNGVGISDIALELQRSENAIVQQIIVKDLFAKKTLRQRTTREPECLCNRCKRSPCDQEGC